VPVVGLEFTSQLRYSKRKGMRKESGQVANCKEAVLSNIAEFDCKLGD
jgi:hypothetical protein